MSICLWTEMFKCLPRHINHLLVGCRRYRGNLVFACQESKPNTPNPVQVIPLLEFCDYILAPQISEQDPCFKCLNLNWSSSLLLISNSLEICLETVASCLQWFFGGKWTTKLSELCQLIRRRCNDVPTALTLWQLSPVKVTPAKYRYIYTLYTIPGLLLPFYKKLMLAIFKSKHAYISYIHVHTLYVTSTTK